MARHCGVEPRDCGVEPRHRDVEAKAIAKVKAAATRKARGTIGKAQKLKIKVTPDLSVQILGPDGQPVSSGTAESSTATPSSSTAAPNSAGSGHTP